MREVTRYVRIARARAYATALRVGIDDDVSSKYDRPLHFVNLALLHKWPLCRFSVEARGQVKKRSTNLNARICTVMGDTVDILQDDVGNPGRSRRQTLASSP